MRTGFLGLPRSIHRRFCLVVAMRSSGSLARRPKAYSAADLEREAAGSAGLNYHDSEESSNGANVGRRATGSAPASGSQLSDRLVVCSGRASQSRPQI
jgi:hypothetical protein